MKHAALAGIALVGLMTSTSVLAEPAVPVRSGHVTDRANLLEAPQRDLLEQKLARFQQRTGTEIAVLIVPKLPLRSIERFSRKVAQTWQIGHDAGDGVLMSVALAERQMRIEVGRELEQVLTAPTCSRILAETIKPHFKREEFFAGIDSGVDQVLAIIAPEAAVPQAAAATPPQAPATAAQPTAANAAPAKTPFGRAVSNGKVLILLFVGTLFLGALMPPVRFLLKLRVVLSAICVGVWFWALQRYAALPLLWLWAACAGGGLVMYIALRVRDDTDETDEEWWWRRYISNRHSDISSGSSSNSSGSSSSNSSSSDREGSSRGGGASDNW